MIFLLFLYRDWCEWTASQLTERYSYCLLGGGDPLSCTVLNWEEVKISEETEGGNTVESIIRVPAQVSCHYIEFDKRAKPITTFPCEALYTV